MPEYCRVQGGLEDVILFEVTPTTAWNNKFFYVGGAGYNGSVPELTDALARSYAAAATPAIAASIGTHQRCTTTRKRRWFLRTAPRIWWRFWPSEWFRRIAARPPRQRILRDVGTAAKMALMEVERCPSTLTAWSQVARLLIVPKP